MPNFLLTWYPVFGVFFMAVLLVVFILLYRSTIRTTKPEHAKASQAAKVAWDDIQGIDEVKDELQELVLFLKDPARFKSLGAVSPKGILLHGPPGTGKTMLARAVASQAGVDFYAASGSSFTEMFVGRGAARIRRLFKEAKKSGRAVIFIDEIEAVGGHRGQGSDGGNSERDQTLNALLVELDGFTASEVVVIGASNRLDQLDPALLRPGRFDRKILVPPPSKEGRFSIIEVHTKNKPLAPTLDLESLAIQTAGMTGAGLANACNEAAILAGRANKTHIEMEDFEEALLREAIGSESSRRMSDKESRIVAYHEAGHALIRARLNIDPVHRISIIGRGGALGYVISLPEEDRYLSSKQELFDKLTVLAGGRAGEELGCGQQYSGAIDDLRKMHAISRQMVSEFSMRGKDCIALPVGEYSVSEETRRLVDQEQKSLCESAYKRAISMLNNNTNYFERLAQELLRRETLTGQELEELLK